MNCLKCEKCNYSTTFKHCFERHLLSKRHLEERINEYHCEKCKYTTSNKQNYERHLQSSSHLEEKTKEFRCEKCNYTTTNKQNFEIHLKSKKHTEGKQKFEPIFCPCCEIQLCTSKQHIEHKNSIKHKQNLQIYKPPAPSPVPTTPAVPPAVVRPKPDFYKPFHTTFLPTPDTIKQLNLPENTGRIRIYARKVEDNYKVGILFMEDKNKDIRLGLVTKEKLKEITAQRQIFSNDDDEFGCHHILGYIES